MDTIYFLRFTVHLSNFTSITKHKPEHTAFIFLLNLFHFRIKCNKMHFKFYHCSWSCLTTLNKTGTNEIGNTTSTNNQKLNTHSHLSKLFNVWTISNYWQTFVMSSECTHRYRENSFTYVLFQFEICGLNQWPEGCPVLTQLSAV